MPEGVQAPHARLVVCEDRTVLSLKSFRGEWGGMGEIEVAKRNSCQKLKASGQGPELCNSSHNGKEPQTRCFRCFSFHSARF